MQKVHRVYSALHGNLE